LKQSQISTADNFALTRSRSVIRFIVTGDKFARAVAEPISVESPAGETVNQIPDPNAGFSKNGLNFVSGRFKM